MINAKQELLKKLEGLAPIKCAKIFFNENADLCNNKILLKVSYSATDFKKFLDELDFVYDDGYGGDELFGTIWLVDGTWLTRCGGELTDGLQWWRHHKLPEISSELI